MMTAASNSTSTKNDPLIHQVLESRYRVDAQIGKGGAGIVYRGTDLTLGREVAIKTLHADQDSQNALDDFIKEARALAQIDHPKIVPIYAIGQHDGYHYLVMKLLEGETLEALLKRVEFLPPQKVRDLIQQTCEALQALHQRSLVHRDLKPANLMIAPNGQITVMDLGIAKQEDQEATLGISLVGTPKYMPPETLSNLPIDGRSDIYSLGIIAYQALTGTPPFDGATSMAILYQQAHETARPIKEQVPTAPANLIRAIEIAMAKNPNDRFQNAKDFSDAVSPNAKILTSDNHHGQWKYYGALLLIGGILWIIASVLMNAPEKKTLGLEDIQKKQNELNQQKLQQPQTKTNQSTTDLNQNPSNQNPSNQNPSNQNPSNQNPSSQNPNHVVHSNEQAQEKVKIFIDSVPRADIFEFGKKIGQTPYTIHKPSSSQTLRYVLKYPGFKDEVVNVSLKNSFSKTVILKDEFELLKTP
jgi:serine/threonine protein kinase